MQHLLHVEKGGRQSVTKRSNGRNFTVGGVRFDSGVECYGNKAVNKMQRDCLVANKPPGPLAKIPRDYYFCSPPFVSVTRLKP